MARSFSHFYAEKISHFYAEKILKKNIVWSLLPLYIEDVLANRWDFIYWPCSLLLSNIPSTYYQCSDKIFQNFPQHYSLNSYWLCICTFRSPWSNTYDPPISDGAKPSKGLRDLEIKANQAFDAYRDMYARIIYLLWN